MVGVWFVGVFVLIVQLSERRWLAGTPCTYSLAWIIHENTRQKRKDALKGR
jgi:hypothetical protein